MKRRGKIARLPREIRQELNERLQEEEVATSLAEWLNGLPEVQAILKADFEGAPISEQNISEWRKGGYEEWVQRENALEVAVRLAQRAQELEAGDHRLSLSEALASWLMVRLAVATRELEKMEWEKQWPMVTKMCANLAKLRRIEKEAKKERQAREAATPKTQGHGNYGGGGCGRVVRGPGRGNCGGGEARGPSRGSSAQQPPRCPAASADGQDGAAGDGGAGGEGGEGGEGSAGPARGTSGTGCTVGEGSADGTSGAGGSVGEGGAWGGCSACD